MKNVDNYFYIGSSHDICQDYIVSKKIDNKNLAYCILSDGCSSADETDIGSRLICKFTESFIKEHYDEKDKTEIIYKKLKTYLLEKISNVNFIIDKTSFLATLIVLISNKEKTDIFVFGDGFIKIKTEEKSFIKYFKFTENAPCYLSYDLYKEDKNLYLTYFKQSLEITELTEDSNKTEIKDADSEIYYSFENKNLISISIMSDGVDSFDKKSKKIDLFEVIEKITDYKNTHGNFVKRKMKAFMRDCRLNEWLNKDDLSIGTIFYKDC